MAIKTFFNDNVESTVEELTNNEWDIIDELINILSPLEQATKYMSGDKYSSMSLIIATLSGLIVNLKMLKIKNISLIKIRDHIADSLRHRFSQIEDNEFTTFASLLDPRIKDTCFLNCTKKRIATKKILEKLEQEIKVSTAETPVNTLSQNKDLISNEESPPSKRPKFDLWEFVTEQQEGRVLELTNVAKELDNYLQVIYNLVFN